MSQVSAENKGILGQPNKKCDFSARERTIGKEAEVFTAASESTKPLVQIERLYRVQVSKNTKVYIDSGLARDHEKEK